MLEKLLSPLTTAKASGVLLRDLTVIVGSILTIAGILGYLSPEQIEAIKQQINTISQNLPLVLTALGAMMAAGMSIYRTLFKSTSDKAAEAAKQIDKKLPADAPVKIETPGKQPDIVVQPKKK